MSVQTPERTSTFSLQMEPVDEDDLTQELVHHWAGNTEVKRLAN